MLTGLLITLDIIVCILLTIIVLMQRSEGGAFGMGGGPTGLITARGAGDLLTRTTWVLFTLFLALSLGLTLLGAHDRASSSVIQQLKLQHVNPNALSQPVTPAPAPTGAPLSSAPPPSASFFGPAAQAPLAAPAAQPLPGLGAPTKPHAHQRASQPETSPPAAQPAPPVLEAPAPKPAPSQP
jgi:preprotein translocase subunit SecG